MQPVSQDPKVKLSSTSLNKLYLINTTLLFATSITFVGIIGSLRNDIGSNSDAYPTKYVSYINVSLAGVVIGMVGLLINFIDYWIHQKIYIYVAMVTLTIGWILVFAGMIVGADFYYYSSAKGEVVGLWFIYSFMTTQAMVNMYQTIE